VSARYIVKASVVEDLRALVSEAHEHLADLADISRHRDKTGEMRAPVIDLLSIASQLRCGLTDMKPLDEEGDDGDPDEVSDDEGDDGDPDEVSDDEDETAADGSAREAH